MAETNGKHPEWVILESGDGYTFVVDYETVTRIGSTIPNMLSVDADSGDATFLEARAGRAKFPNVRGVILEKVIEYLCWNAQNSEASEAERIGDFDKRIPPEMAMELFMSADFFEV